LANDFKKIVVVLGPTASGKTSWSKKLAQEFDGEIVSADSRKVYKYMNVGTATPEGEQDWFLAPQSYPQRCLLVEDLPHYLVNWIDPKSDFNLAKFQKLAKKYIELVHQKNKTPFLVGGSGLYIQSVVDNYNIPGVPPQENLRNTLAEFSCQEVLELLKKVDPESAENINENNKRRLIRAFEVSVSTSQPFSQLKDSNEQIYNTLQIGIKRDREELYERINQRVETMFERGLEDEVNNLREQGYDWSLSSMDSIGYQEFKGYFEGEKNLRQVKEDIKTNTRNFAKRQITWFRRDGRINWCENFSEAKKTVNSFVN
jgi:tRNA dimethylallyltransferase